MTGVTRDISKRGSLSSDIQSSHVDLRSWQGLTEVLKMARESSLSSDEYGEFRDLVLRYAQQGGDPEIRRKIDDVLSEIKRRNTSRQQQGIPTPYVADTHAEKSEVENIDDIIKAEVAPSPEKKTDAHFVSRRPTPSFVAKSVEVSEPVPPVLPVAPVETVSDVAEEIKGAATEVSFVPPADISPSAEATPETVQIEGEEHSEENAIEKNEASTPEPEHVEDAPIVVEVPVVTDIASTPASSQSIPQYRDRIAEIKRTVNALVGNPVTLVAQENQLGRDYMAALLGAMKATAPGSDGNVQDAMRKLEETFASIEAHVASSRGAEHVTANRETEARIYEEKNMAEISPEPAVQETTTEPTITTPTIEPSVLIVDVPEIPKPNIQEIEKEIVIDQLPEAVAPIVPSVHESVAAPISAEPVLAQPPTPVIPQAPIVDIPESVIETTVPSNNGSSDHPLHEEFVKEEVKISEINQSSNVVSEMKPDISSEPAKSNFTAKIMAAAGSIPSILDIENSADAHVTHEEKKAEPSISNIESEKPSVSESSITSSVPDEFMAPEITTALNVLLHKWSLFESSGLFGTGPSGVDHPLYKKLSVLNMGDIVAGNFEDSSLQLTHGIKDYADAWRHEQGIVYNPNETFEQYLRRVIQRILKRQSGQKIV